MPPGPANQRPPAPTTTTTKYQLKQLDQLISEGEKKIKKLQAEHARLASAIDDYERWASSNESINDMISKSLESYENSYQAAEAEIQRLFNQLQDAKHAARLEDAEDEKAEQDARARGRTEQQQAVASAAAAAAATARPGRMSAFNPVAAWRARMEREDARKERQETRARRLAQRAQRDRETQGRLANLQAGAKTIHARILQLRGQVAGFRAQVHDARLKARDARDGQARVLEEESELRDQIADMKRRKEAVEMWQGDWV